MSTKDPYIARVVFTDGTTKSDEYKSRRTEDSWTLITNAVGDEWLVIHRNIYAITFCDNPQYKEE